MKTENQDYNKWMNDLVKGKYELSCGSHKMNYDLFCRKCVYFFTLTFDQSDVRSMRNELSLSSDEYSIEFDSFHRIYIYILEKMYGRRYGRPLFRERSPMAIAAIDFEGSRYASFDSLGNRNAHVHALWAVSPDDVQSFRQIVTSAAFRFKLLKSLPCDLVKFAKYEPSRGSIGGAATYAIKSHLKSIHSPRGDELFRIYPHSNYNSNGVTYRLARSYRKMDYNILRLRRAMKNNFHEVNSQRQEWE